MPYIQPIIKPLVSHLHKKLLERDIVHCDETVVQVLKEKDKAHRQSLICGYIEPEMTTSHP